MISQQNRYLFTLQEFELLKNIFSTIQHFQHQIIDGNLIFSVNTESMIQDLRNLVNSHESKNFSEK